MPQGSRRAATSEAARQGSEALSVVRPDEGDVKAPPPCRHPRRPDDALLVRVVHIVDGTIRARGPRSSRQASRSAGWTLLVRSWRGRRSSPRVVTPTSGRPQRATRPTGLAGPATSAERSLRRHGGPLDAPAIGGRSRHCTSSPRSTLPLPSDRRPIDAHARRPAARLSGLANHSTLWSGPRAMFALGGPTGRSAAATGLVAVGINSAVVKLPMKLASRRTARTATRRVCPRGATYRCRPPPRSRRATRRGRSRSPGPSQPR